MCLGVGAEHDFLWSRSQERNERADPRSDWFRAQLPDRMEGCGLGWSEVCASSGSFSSTSQTPGPAPPYVVAGGRTQNLGKLLVIMAPGKCFLAGFNSVLAAVGSAFVSSGGELIKNADMFKKDDQKSVPFSVFTTILIVQGSVMVAAGTGQVYSVWKENRSNLKKFCAFLAVLALVDVIIAVVLYFKIKEFGNTVVEIYNSSYDEILSGNGDPAVSGLVGLMHNLLCCGVPTKKDLCQEPHQLDLYDCPWLITVAFSIIAPAVMVVFLGTAVLLIVAMIINLKFLKQTATGDQEISARYSGS
ncbi:hypothetical protein Q5P01_017724 [Channa striata]|uniref:Tetraspanin n=1 Tax=Channa striata TaxID=64152 RepID=A0AA88M9X2_CHASR|nr:hypothetical protein Q5P01_017724 [Channa striata]